MQLASDLRRARFIQAARVFALVAAFGFGVESTYAKDIYVSPDQGNDATGTGAASAPYQTLQHALQDAAADCGDVIHLDRGVYRENIATTFDCDADAPLLITGPRTAIIVGADKNGVRPGRIFQVLHDHYRLQGFTIEGNSEDQCCAKKLLYVVPNDLEVDGYVEGNNECDLATGDYVEGFSAAKLMLRNAAEECLRLKFVTGAVVEKTIIRNCGVLGFANGRKNGEGVYIGADSNQWPRRKDDPSVTLTDESRGNLIWKNRIDGRGNGSECVDVKEGAAANVVERNSCTGLRDADSGGVSIQGNENVVRYNAIYKNAGAGVRFGGNLGFGVDNDAYKNTIRKNQGYGMKIVATPQGLICDNKLLKNAAGDVNNGAGHETTVNLIGNGTLALLRHPEQAAKLRQRPTLIESAIEECLRYDSPVQMTGRQVKEDIEIEGRRLQAGERVFTLIGSANRDSMQFSEPERFDVTRTDNRHLAFGHGIHFCLGASLARLEGQIALGTLVRRLPGLQLASDAYLQWRDAFTLRGLQSLPVTF